MKTPSSISARVLSRFYIATMAVALTGCPDEDSGTPGGTEGDPSACGFCPSGEAGACQCVGHSTRSGCFPTYGTCDSFCAGKNPPAEVSAWAPIACFSNDPEGSCTGWNPSSHITYVTATQTYEIDEDWIADMVDGASAPLWTCDDAGFEAKVNGFKVINASSGEFLYQIGLRNNDEIQTVNGINVTTWAGAEAVFGQYLSGGTVNYLAVVKRGVNNIQLKWKLVP